MEPQPTETSVTPMSGPEANNIEVSNKKKKTIKEDGGAMVGGQPVNHVSGDIAGIGLGKQGEPGVSKKRKSPIVLGMFRRKYAK